MVAAETHEDHQTAKKVKCNAYDALRIQTEMRNINLLINVHKLKCVTLVNE